MHASDKAVSSPDAAKMSLAPSIAAVTEWAGKKENIWYHLWLNKNITNPSSAR